MEDILYPLKKFRSQRIVAQKLLELGISVKDGKAYCEDIELSDSAIARACEVDRRVVRQTLQHISEDVDLNSKFSKLRPMLSMVDLAPEIGCSSLVIVPTDATIPGIISDVTTLLYHSGITLRQATIHDDGRRQESTLEIVVDGRIPENIIMLLRSCRGVAGVIIK